MGAVKRSFEHLRQDDLNENIHGQEGIPMYNSAPKDTEKAPLVNLNHYNFDSYLTLLENALSEHISLLKEVNKNHKPETMEGYWDYQTVAEANEALVELRRILTP